MNQQLQSVFQAAAGLQREAHDGAIAEALAAALKLPRVRLDAVDVEARALKLVTPGLARKHTCLPLRIAQNKLVLAMSNPLDREAVDDVRFASSRDVERVVAGRSEILEGIEKHYAAGAAQRAANKASGGDASPAGNGGVLDFDRLDPNSNDTAPAVQLCDVIVRDAIARQASDIHIEPGPRELLVRLRVDGVLQDHLQVPRWLHGAVVSRVKILARLDIAQQRLPQDGRVTITHEGRALDLRVSTLPTHFGEKVVLRLLGSARTPALAALGLSEGETSMLDEALRQPQGMILVTGPTGAGKSTTLYSMLARRQSPEVNIVTIEDPIEYQVTGINQVQVDARAGLTFASSLRAILRQDPDVILVGEIRDLETAEIAFQAALTGHLVFSTLHTNGSLAAIDRLRDLGLRPLLLASAVDLIVAQRLARRVCDGCRVSYAPAADALRRLRLEPGRLEFQRGRGCARCSQTGYAGRVGIFEMLRLTPRIKDLVTGNAGAAEIRQEALRSGTRFLVADAIDKISRGLTTVEEILRVIRIEADEPADGNRHGVTQPLVAVRAS
jgi:type IV pilus assembly protein PilB